MKVKNQIEKEKEMKITLSNKVLVTDIPLQVLDVIEYEYTMPNPEFVEAEKKGLSTVGIPETLELYENTKEGLTCPKGTQDMVYEICYTYKDIKPKFYDNRRIINPVNISFHGELEPSCKKAADSVYRYTIGRWKPPTWIDKKRIVLYLIAQREQPALIVVHSQELWDEWVDYIEKYLKIKAADVGKIGEGKVRIGEKITVAMVQTLHKRAAEVAPHIGHLILDAKTSRVTGKQYLEIVEQFDCKYQLWLTPSSSWSDSFDEIIECYVGPIIGQIDNKELLNNGNLYQGEAFFIPTGFTPVTDPSVNESLAITEMTQDLDRNLLIAKTILKYRCYGFTLVLSERQQQCEAIGDLLKNHYCESRVAVITSETPTRQRQQIMKDLGCGWGSRFLLATNQTINNFFDLPEIETLVITTPLLFSNSFMDTIRLALRPGLKKNRTVILDFADDHEEFQSSAQISWEVYKILGLSVLGRI